MAIPAKPVLESVVVTENRRVAEGVGLLTLRAPRCAAALLPGQFVHLRVLSRPANLLRRPFSVHRVMGDSIVILYQVLGAVTRAMAELEPGDRSIDLIGPLGHGWTIPDSATHALIVAGGLGAAPLGMLADELAERGIATVAALGAPCEDRLVGREVFDSVCRRVDVATDDGSAGLRGYVVELTRGLLAAEHFDVVYTCGPQVMQQIVAEQAATHGISCQVSLERLMACGVGACLSCIVETRGGQKRACVDGPVFDGAEVIWDASQSPSH